MKIQFIADKPIENDAEDLLEFKEFAFLIKNSIEQTQTPFVYGILGDWGSGKTSLLRLVKNMFNTDFEEGSSPYVPIWFDAWQYENEENIIYPLLHSVKNDYDKRIESPGGDGTFKKSFLRITTSSFLAITDLALRAITKHFTDEPLTMKEIKEQLSEADSYLGEREMQDNILTDVSKFWADEVSSFRKTFGNFMESYASEIANRNSKFEQDKIRFVFLIDDLDRCLPSNAISLIENIKNHLTVKNTIFVFCLNPKAISTGIQNKFVGLDIEGQEYLEKILNFSYYVPEPFPDIFAEFIRKSFQNLIIDDEMSEKFKPLFNLFAEILEKCRFNNPRKIKRILNRYLLLISWFPDVEKYQEECDNDNVVRLIILSEYFPSLFALLVKYYYENLTLHEIISDLNEEHIEMQEFKNKYGFNISSLYQRMSREIIRFNPEMMARDLLRVNQVARIA